MSDARRVAVGLLALALIAFVMLGLADGALGVAWPSIRSEFGRSVSDLGVLLAFGSIGYLTASGGYGWAHARIGTGAALALGGAFMTIAMTGVAFAASWAIMAGSSLLFGVGGGLIDTGMNAHAALEFDVRSINLLHAAYGVGATLGPLVITLSLTAGASWRGGYAAMAVAQASVAALVWATRRRWVAEPGDPPGPSALPPARRRTVSLLLVLFLVYTGVEVAAGQWAFTLLTESRAMPTAAAGWWVAAYWGGLTAGRLLFGVVGDRITADRLLDSSALVALAGLGLLWADPGGAGAIGLPIAGLGFAAIFPTLVSLTPARIGRDRSTRMVGYQLAAANVGAASIPWLMGLIAGTRGVGSLGPALFAGTLLFGLLEAGTRRSL